MFANVIKIDPKKLEKFVNSRREVGESAVAISKNIGASKSYISVAKNTGTMTAVYLKSLCMYYNMKESDFTPDPKPVVATPEPEQAPEGYSLNLIVREHSVCVQLLMDGEVKHLAWGKRLTDTEFGLIQAISYATHLIYKKAEKKKLEEEEMING